MTTLQGRDPHSGNFIELTLHEGRIAEVRNRVDGPSLWLAPGFIDLQVNGFAGHDLNDEHITPDTVLAVATHLLATGVTTFLPTLITQSEERLLQALNTIREAREQHPLVAGMVPGIHMEGPAISPEDGPRGAHPREHVRLPSIEEVDRWQQASNNLIALVTLSPHTEEHIAFIAALRARHIHLAIGHTHCTPHQIQAATNAGAQLSTHLGNGVAATLPRHPNLLWEQLADDRLTATFIADGHHLPPSTLQSMIRAKGTSRSILISDAVALAGMAPGIYRSPIGGNVELSEQGRLSIVGTPFLAGAALPLTTGIAHAMRTAGISFSEAIHMVTTNPASFAHRNSTLTVGADANLVRFDLSTTGDLAIESTWLAGEEVYSARSASTGSTVAARREGR